MKDNFEISLLNSANIMKKGYAIIAANTGKAIATITLVVASLVIFTDISFAHITSNTFTSTMAIMLIASYLMYFSMEDAGERLGEESEEFKQTDNKYRQLADKITGERIADLRNFCRSYSLSELEYRRISFLIKNGYSDEEFCDYKNGAKYSKKATRVFRKAEKLKPITVTPATLLSKGSATSKSELLSPDTGKLFTMILKLIPTTVCTLVTVSLVLNVKENMNAAVIIDGILKLSSLPIIGFKGYAAGYNYAKGTLKIWTETKTRLLDAFLKSKA